MATPKAVKEYLSDKNVNSLLKWVTTELVIHKPEDPIIFIHNLTRNILSSNDYKYSPENIQQLIAAARTKSDEQVESENDRFMKNPATLASPKTESQEIAGLNEDFSRIVDSMRAIAGELNPKLTATNITQQTCNMLQCDYSILYTYDAEHEVISINSEESLKEMKFPVNKGIIGRCIRNGRFEIVDQVQKDPDYDEAIDKILNITTKNLLCCPLKDFETGEVYGVIEAINKNGGDVSFNNHDVDLLNALGTIGHISLQNGIIYEMAATESKRNQAMLDLWSHLNDDTKVFNINSLLFVITRRCLEIVDAEKCTFYFVDHQNKELWSLQGEVNIRMPIDKGIAGLCATSGEVVNEANVYNNQQFDQETDKKTGFITKSMLCVPMKGSENKVIGVIQLINKQGVLDTFDEADQQILQLVLSAAAPIVERNQLFMVKTSPTKDEKYVNDLKKPPTFKHRQSSLSHDIINAVVEETNEENEEEEEVKPE